MIAAALLARMRGKVTDQYWAADRDIVWSTAEREIPVIRQALVQAIERA